MPDLTATRPVSGEPVATLWGQQVHDGLEGIQAGSILISISSNTQAVAAVTFPRPYASPPIVVVASGHPSGGFFAACDSITTTGFQARMASRDTTNVSSPNMPCNWIAIGTPA